MSSSIVGSTEAGNYFGSCGHTQLHWKMWMPLERTIWSHFICQARHVYVFISIAFYDRGTTNNLKREVLLYAEEQLIPACFFSLFCFDWFYTRCYTHVEKSCSCVCLCTWTSTCAHSRRRQEWDKVSVSPTILSCREAGITEWRGEGGRQGPSGRKATSL